ncbi:MAG: M48 family metallopeptidase [Armatimonadetes bacterium]|nr:M48 family metallopeptidase [Armatimonadota bacterium]MDE2207979.1 M48 family metallopeptidase [Armatimonadota bacterium]
MTQTMELPQAERVRFPGLSSAAIEHPADRAALEVLRRTFGVDRVLRQLSNLSGERFLRILFTGDAVRVSPKQAPSIYADLQEACAILDVKEPELYLMQDPRPNAFAFGMKKYTIVMTTGLVELLTPEERLAVIGHELGHIKAEHMVYRTMAIIIARLMNEVIGSITPLGSLLSSAMLYALFVWFRRSELTADRAGLLTVQNESVCIMALLKLAGGSPKLSSELDPDEFALQADQFEDLDESWVSLYYKYLMVQHQTHPFPALRARELKEWAASDSYRKLLRGDYPHADPDAGRRTCPTCGSVVTNVTWKFCQECGAELPTV